MRPFGRPLLPASLRARLVLAFVGVVTIALAFVVAALPRLLDGYFAQQEKQNLKTRSEVVGVLMFQRIVQDLALRSERARPILMPSRPLRESPELVASLSDPEFVRDITRFARADVIVTVAADPARPDETSYRFQAPVPPDLAEPGEQRERLSSEPVAFTLRDGFWSQFGGTAPQRRFSVVLSDPFTLRAQTLQTIVGVMIAATLLALPLATLSSLLLANRLTNPIRRLTNAARSLAEGRLDARVALPESGSPEVGELASAFNSMAEQLQRSIQFIRRDRDRSRDFLADVSHELRTPIAALRTFNELLREGADADPATRREFLEQSGGQIERLDWLATNLLELSRLESGLVALDLRPDDLRAVVEDAVEQAEAAARRKGVALEQRLPPGPVRVQHDPQRIGQVITNLVGNALKFTPPGGRVEVALQATREGAEIRVADTGIGIDASELPHVFERFYRGSQAHELRAGGSGLGLSIVHSVIEMHGGRVTIESTLREGTEVRVTLPRHVALSSPSAARG